MGRRGLTATGYLALDDVAEDAQVARRLPPELAWRLHALPVAEDHGQITVAMANPDDDYAKDALAAALGAVTCIVRADATAIDSRLARIWGEQTIRPLDLVACCYPDEVTGDVWAYTQMVGDHLGARVSRAEVQTQLEAALGERGTAHADAILFGDARHPAISRFLAHVPTVEQAATAASALWVAPRPRWPLRRILLVIGGTSADGTAIEWTVRIARPAGSLVTVLTIVPPAPAMYGGRMEQGLPALLKSTCPLGHRMREAAHRLVESEVEATLRLRAGPAEWQVCHEIVEGDHDLVVLATGHPQRWLRWLDGDIAGPLLSRIDRPLLITTANPRTEIAE